MAELLRCSNADWERINRELEDLIPANSSGSSIRGFSSNMLESSGESHGIISVLQSDKHHSMASLKGAMRRYYQSGISRHSPSTSSGGAQIPFNWFGSVPLGKEQIVESALVSISLLSSMLRNQHFISWALKTKEGAVSRFLNFSK